MHFTFKTVETTPSGQAGPERARVPTLALNGLILPPLWPRLRPSVQLPSYSRLPHALPPDVSKQLLVTRLRIVVSVGEAWLSSSSCGSSVLCATF